MVYIFVIVIYMLVKLVNSIVQVVIILYIIKFNIIIEIQLQMKDSSSRNNNTPKNNPNNYPIRYNQQSTNNLLKQLQLSLIDVQHIIKKSKQTLGIKDKSPRQLSHSRTRDLSEINFNMSIASNSLQGQLTYSVSPETKSRVHTEQNQPKMNKNSTGIIRKLYFHQNKQKIKQLKEKDQIKSIRSKSQDKLSIFQQLKRQKMQYTQQKESKDQKLDINQISPISIEQQSFEQQKHNNNQQQYSIVIHKYKNQPLAKIQQTQQSNKSSFFKSNSYMTNQQLQMSEKLQLLNKYSQLSNNSLIKIQTQDSKSKIPQIDESIVRRQRVKIFKDKNNTNSDTKNKQQLVENKGKANYMNAIQQQLQNTCVKNELQNILLKNCNQKKLKTPQANKSSYRKPTNQFTKMKERIHQNNSKKNIMSPLSNREHIQFKKQIDQIKKSRSKSKSKSKSPSREFKKLPDKFSPLKSPDKSSKIKQIKRQEYSIPNSTKVNSPTYIKKYLNTIQIKQFGDRQKLTNRNIIQDKNYRYSHPSKSLEKRKSTALEIQDYLKNYSAAWSRQQFVEKMLQQCYVRRFLTASELNLIYEQFCNKKVPRYQWQQKVIQKIFKKIHEVDDII